MSRSLPFPLPSLFKPLAPSIAQTRLKLNIFGLAVLVLFRSIFTPYRQFRRGLIWFSDEYIQGRARGQVSWAKRGVWWIETILTLVTIWNITEAYFSVNAPAGPPRPAAVSGLQLTPSRMSSPLTRPYPLSSKGSATPSQQTPTRPQHALQAQHHPSSSLARTASNNNGGIPGRSSPLSASTAKALNLPFRPRESTGLFYPEDAGASPSKVGRGGQGAGAGGGNGSGNSLGVSAMGRTGSAEEFVMVEREEKEWVDNVWKGVRGKGGKVGL